MTYPNFIYVSQDLILVYIVSTGHQGLPEKL